MERAEALTGRVDTRGTLVIPMSQNYRMRVDAVMFIKRQLEVKNMAEMRVYRKIRHGYTRYVVVQMFDEHNPDHQKLWEKSRNLVWTVYEPSLSKI